MAPFRSVSAVEIRSDGVVLGGEVWTPGADVAGGVLMIGGSGPTDRSNGGYFDAYRVALANYGVAGLWYDKRGVGASSADYLAGTLDDVATDALAAAGHLPQAVGRQVPVVCSATARVVGWRCEPLLATNKRVDRPYADVEPALEGAAPHADFLDHRHSSRDIASELSAPRP